MEACLQALTMQIDSTSELPSFSAKIAAFASGSPSASTRLPTDRVHKEAGASAAPSGSPIRGVLGFEDDTHAYNAGQHPTSTPASSSTQNAVPALSAGTTATGTHHAAPWQSKKQFSCAAALAVGDLNSLADVLDRDQGALDTPRSTPSASHTGNGQSSRPRRRSFFCRTSSSVYSVQRDEEPSQHWCSHDNAVYGDDYAVLDVR